MRGGSTRESVGIGRITIGRVTVWPGPAGSVGLYHSRRGCGTGGLSARYARKGGLSARYARSYAPAASVVADGDRVLHASSSARFSFAQAPRPFCTLTQTKVTVPSRSAQATSLERQHDVTERILNLHPTQSVGLTRVRLVF